MLNMLHGEFYKLKKSRSFYIIILIAMGLILLLYATLHMVDNIHEEEQSGNTRIVVKGEEEVVLDEEGNVVPISQQVGIMGIVQQMFDSHFTEFIIAIFISIFVTAEFGNGAIKNVVGKGYSRRTVFLSKLIAAVFVTIIMSLAIIMIIIVLGIPFLGKKGLEMLVWKDLSIYIGIQMIFGISFTGIINLVGEFTRSLAASISINLGILMFSTSITAGLDLLFHNLNWKPSQYWVLDFQSACPITNFDQTFIIRGIIVSVIWFLITTVIGVMHFKKADVK